MITRMALGDTRPWRASHRAAAAVTPGGDSTSRTVAAAAAPMPMATRRPQPCSPHSLWTQQRLQRGKALSVFEISVSMSCHLLCGSVASCRPLQT